MALTINFTTGFSSFPTNFVGLKAYLDYYETTFSSPTHAASLEFFDGPGDLDIGGTTYYQTYGNGGVTDIIGHHLASTSTTSANVSFLLVGGTTELEDGDGDHYTVDDIIYTGDVGGAAAHRLVGNVEDLIFGNGAYSSGSLSSTLFTISGLGVLSNGLLDTVPNGGDGAYDAVDTTPSGVHDIIFGLMGGLGGSGATDVLRDYFDTLGTIQNGNNNADEVFDSFGGSDVFNLGTNSSNTVNFYAGFANDVVNGFNAGSASGHDVLAFADDVFASVGDILDPNNNHIKSYTGFSVVEYDGSNKVYLIGVNAANLVAANFDVFPA